MISCSFDWFPCCCWESLPGLGGCGAALSCVCLMVKRWRKWRTTLHHFLFLFSPPPCAFSWAMSSAVLLPVLLDEYQPVCSCRWHLCLVFSVCRDAERGFSLTVQLAALWQPSGKLSFPGAVFEYFCFWTIGLQWRLIKSEGFLWRKAHVDIPILH